VTQPFDYVENVPNFPILEVKEGPEGRFYKTPSGLWVPSITTVLGSFKADSLASWRERVGYEEAEQIARQAAFRGTQLHNFCEQYLTNVVMNYRAMMPGDLELFKIIRPELNKISKIRHVEAALYSEKARVAGRSDVIGDYDEVLSVVDFKSTTKSKKEEWIDNYFEQATAYGMMYEELTGIAIPQIVVIIAGRESGIQTFVKKPEDYRDGLLKKLNAFHTKHLTLHK